MLVTMKQDEDEPGVIFDPGVGRFVPPPERRPVPRGCLAAFMGTVGGVVLGALTGALLAPTGGSLVSLHSTLGYLSPAEYERMNEEQEQRKAA
jgi:hypothetical protein